VSVIRRGYDQHAGRAPYFVVRRIFRHIDYNVRMFGQIEKWNKMMRFTERRVLVTGAASGIGAAVVARLCAEGAHIVAVDRDASGLVALAAQSPAHIETVVVDLLDAEQTFAALVDVACDALCNAAGGSGRRAGDGPVDTCTLDGWNYTLQLNLTSQFLVSKACLPSLLARRGAIVNIASVLGMVGGDADFATHAYAASKAGIIGLSRAMAAYYAPQGVRVNVVAPGLIATPMSERAQQNPDIRARLPQLQPLTGEFGQASDVAAAVAYLLSDDARFVTGTVLTVDGGWTTQ
jgi:NAD(P)-dependent dehydrogenase (short-subunit alcohol dehydrogenase family)